MKKKVLFTVFIVFITSLCSSRNLKIKDFYFCENGNYIYLGDSLKKYDPLCDTKPFILKDLGNNRFKVYNYKWGEIYVPYKSSSYKIFGIVITSPKVNIIDFIKVGDSKKRTLEILGTPEINNKSNISFYNEDFDVLELKIYFNVFKRISKIQIFMGT